MKTWVAAIAAVVVQPLVLFARFVPALLSSSEPMYGVGLFLVAVCVVAAAVVLVLGVPAFLLLRRLQRESWISLALTGVVLGALPIALSWPRHLDGYSAGSNWHGKYVQTYVNGTPTNYAWLSFAENVAFFGLHGLVGALAFYGVWQRLNRTERRPQPASPSHGA